MSFGKKILDYKEDIIADLGELIAIQSVFRTDCRQYQ